MILSSYETHEFPNPLLPFIYHPCYHLVGEEVETNWHKNIEILCCLQGSGYVRNGSSICDFTENDIVVVNSDTLHTIGSSKSLKYSCLIIGNGFCADNGLNVENLTFQSVIRDSWMLEELKNIADIHSCFDGSRLGAVADYRYAVLAVLRRLGRDYCVRKATSSSEMTREHIKKAITYIRKNITHKLSLDEIATHAGISKFHLAREFKTVTGNTIVGFINITRCSEAKRLIQKGMSVSSAAYSCGFDNLSYFSRTFRKTTGKNPSYFVK